VKFHEKVCARIAAAEVWRLLEIKAGQRTQDMNARMGEAMRAMGFKRKKVRIYGELVNGYRRRDGQIPLVVCTPPGEEPYISDKPRPAAGDVSPIEGVPRARGGTAEPNGE